MKKETLQLINDLKEHICQVEKQINEMPEVREIKLNKYFVAGFVVSMLINFYLLIS